MRGNSTDSAEFIAPIPWITTTERPLTVVDKYLEMDMFAFLRQLDGPLKRTKPHTSNLNTNANADSTNSEQP